MGDNRTDDPPPSGGVFRRRWRIFLIAGLTGAGLALLLGILFRDWIFGPWRSNDALDNHFPAGALADYVPEDSEAVVAVNLRTALESPAGRRLLAPSLKQLLADSEDRNHWIELLGINPLDDVDYLQFSFAPGKGGQPLWLARGRPDRSRFRIGPDLLRKKTVDHFRVLEYTDRQTNRKTTLAPMGDTLVASDTPARVMAALNRAGESSPGVVRDAKLRELLKKVDRRQSIWGVAVFKGLDLGSGIDNFFLRAALRPLFEHADRVYGGLTFGDDVRAELHLHTSSEESAVKLENDLKSFCELAQTAPRLMRLQKEILPLVRLLSVGQTSREGQSVSLRCRLTADQLGE
jgi:hypothetical protein